MAAHRERVARGGPLIDSWPSRMPTLRGLADGAGSTLDSPREPTLHSITSSARERVEGGTVRSSASAVLRLTTSSKVVGCCTGRSAGLAPARIFPTEMPAWL